MGLRMRHAEPAQHVGKLVLQPCASIEHGASQPRGDQALAARLTIVAVGDRSRQELSKAAGRIGCKRHCHRRAVGNDQPADAKAFLEAHSLPWAQAYLGGRASDTDDVLSRYAISFIPTYILLGPDGKLIHRGDNLDAVAEILRRELK